MQHTDVLSVRALQKQEIKPLADYWYCSDVAYLQAMGIDVQKLPSREGFEQMIDNFIQTPIEQRKSYPIVWLLNGEPVGHSNTNPTFFADHAFMHLHLWYSDNRKRGMGLQFVKLSVKHYFETLQLKNLYCEPYTHNEAPNKTLQKAGFSFVKQHITNSGFLFEQPVNQWLMTYDMYLASEM